MLDLLTDEPRSTEELAEMANLSKFAAKKRLRRYALEGDATRLEEPGEPVRWRLSTDAERERAVAELEQLERAAAARPVPHRRQGRGPRHPRTRR